MSTAKLAGIVLGMVIAGNLITASFSFVIARRAAATPNTTGG